VLLVLLPKSTPWFVPGAHQRVRYNVRKRSFIMNRSFPLLIGVVAVIFAAVLGVMRVMDVIDNDELLDIGLKTALVLGIVLLAGLVIGMLSKPSATK
jgi:hypothetical protein